MALKQTPLHNWHQTHGGRMVEFGGWSMPVQYSGIVAEHQAVRTAAGVFDISHMGRLWFDGPDALPFVEYLFTNEVASMKIGQVRYGLLCNDAGGIRDDVLIYRWEDGIGMVVNAGNRPKIVDWVAERAGTFRAKMHDTSDAGCMIAVQGPKAVELCRGITPAAADRLGYYHSAKTTYVGKNCLVSRTGYTGEDGLEFVVAAEQGQQLWEELLTRGALPCGLGARDSLRLEAAMPLYGHELSETIDPLQAGLGWAVKLKKGDFVGREALLKRKDDPTRSVRVGLVLDGPRSAREGFNVLAGDQSVGRVTSGAPAPTIGKPIAMAYVEPQHAIPGTNLTIDIRGHPAQAQVVPLPFYKRFK